MAGIALKPTPAGEFRHRVTIERPVITRAAMGQPVTAWETFAILHAAVRPTTGNETFGARVIEQSIDLKLAIRFNSGINELMRVKFREKIYDIVAVLEWDMIQREQTLLCKTGVNVG